MGQSHLRDGAAWLRRQATRATAKHTEGTGTDAVMANATDPFAQQVHGTNPQYLIEKITRLKIINCRYWKESCFGLTSELLIDKAIALKYVGGSYGGQSKPSNFLCLVLKMLQLQPEKEIVLEFIRNEDFKYLRLLGAFYMRMVGRPEEVYQELEPLYRDYRKVAFRNAAGWAVKHVDEVIDALLHDELVCDVALPHLPKRLKLEQLGLLGERQSALDVDDGDVEAELEAMRRQAAQGPLPPPPAPTASEETASAALMAPPAALASGSSSSSSSSSSHSRHDAALVAAPARAAESDERQDQRRRDDDGYRSHARDGYDDRRWRSRDSRSRSRSRSPAGRYDRDRDSRRDRDRRRDSRDRDRDRDRYPRDRRDRSRSPYDDRRRDRRREDSRERTRGRDRDHDGRERDRERDMERDGESQREPAPSAPVAAGDDDDDDDGFMVPGGPPAAPEGATAAATAATKQAKAEKTFDKMFKKKGAPAAGSGVGGGATGVPAAAEGSVEYWNQIREGLGMKKLKE